MRPAELALQETAGTDEISRLRNRFQMKAEVGLGMTGQRLRRGLVIERQRPVSRLVGPRAKAGQKDQRKADQDQDTGHGLLHCARPTALLQGRISAAGYSELSKVETLVTTARASSESSGPKKRGWMLPTTATCR